MHELILNEQHCDAVLGRLVEEAERFLWIVTADVKDVHVEGPGRRYVPFLSILADRVHRGVEVRLIHAKEPGPAFREDFDRFLLRWGTNPTDLELASGSDGKEIVFDRLILVPIDK